MLTSQGILRKHYSLVFPAQLISDVTKYKRKPSEEFKEKKRKRSHDSQKWAQNKEKETTKRGFKRNARFLLQRKVCLRNRP